MSRKEWAKGNRERVAKDRLKWKDKKSDRKKATQTQV